MSRSVGLISEYNRNRIWKQNSDNPLSASELRSIFTTGRCCSDKNCMARIRLPKDPSCCPTCAFTQERVFCGECPTPGNETQQRQHTEMITNYEATIIMIRQPLRAFRAPATATKTDVTGYHKAMSTYLMNHFSSRFFRLK